MVNREGLQFHRRSHDKMNSHWAYDAKGIPLCRVCGECEHLLPLLYAPEVLGLRGRYEDVVEECIDGDGDFDPGYDYGAE